jgi:hypothetical protein
VNRRAFPGGNTLCCALESLRPMADESSEEQVEGFFVAVQ